MELIMWLEETKDKIIHFNEWCKLQNYDTPEQAYNKQVGQGENPDKVQEEYDILEKEFWEWCNNNEIDGYID